MNIGVVGAGAIGGWIAARLALAGHCVSVLARGETLASLRAGLSLREQGQDQVAAVQASDCPEQLGPQDLLIIAVKAPALGQIAPRVAPMIGETTLVVPMLNGVPWWFLGDQRLSSVDPDGVISASFPAERLIGCVVHATCRRLGPGNIEVVHADRLILGEAFGGLSDRVASLAAIFENAGIRTDASREIRQAIWYKLWGNMTINPLSALTLATADRILADQDMRAFILSCMAEAARIGEAIDCPISESGEDRLQVTARLGAFKTSMLQDVEAGRPIELEAMVGAPREIGRGLGQATPNIDLLYAMTRAIAESRGLI